MHLSSISSLRANGLNTYVQWGKKVFSQPPIVQVLPLKKMREACNSDGTPPHTSSGVCPGWCSSPRLKEHQSIGALND